MDTMYVTQPSDVGMIEQNHSETSLWQFGTRLQINHTTPRPECINQLHPPRTTFKTTCSTPTCYLQALAAQEEVLSQRGEVAQALQYCVHVACVAQVV